MTEDHCQPYDEQSLDALVEVIRKATTPKTFERNLAYLMLAHPTSPDAFRALEMIKDELKVGYVYKKGQRAVNNLGTTLLKTMLILDLQSATSEAQWARDTLQKKVSPRLGKSRRYRCSAQEGPQATAPVDEIEYKLRQR